LQVRALIKIVFHLDVLSIGDVQNSVPLEAIFFLEKSSTDCATPLKRIEASYLIMKSSIEVYQRFFRDMPKSYLVILRKQLFNNACAITGNIPAFRLQITRDGSFWDVIESTMKCGMHF